MTLASLARAIGATPKWIQNTERTLGRRFERSVASASELLAIHLLQHAGEHPAARPAARLAGPDGA